MRFGAGLECSWALFLANFLQADSAVESHCWACLDFRWCDFGESIQLITLGLNNLLQSIV
jgi:hypothetical protein